MIDGTGMYVMPGFVLAKACAERFPAAAAWLLRGYAVEPPPYVRQDLAERAAGGTAT